MSVGRKSVEGMNEEDAEWVRRNEQHHEIIDEMIDEIRAFAVRISDGNRLSRDARWYRTVIDMEYRYRKAPVAIQASIAWMPMLDRFEVCLISEEGSVVIPAETQYSMDDVLDAILRISQAAHSES
jgi:hypothetical protein